MMRMCTWCLDPDSEDVDDTLCYMHQAELEGLTVSDLDDRDRIHYAEWLDTQG